MVDRIKEIRVQSRQLHIARATLECPFRGQVLGHEHLDAAVYDRLRGVLPAVWDSYRVGAWGGSVFVGGLMFDESLEARNIQCPESSVVKPRKQHSGVCKSDAAAHAGPARNRFPGVSVVD